MSVAPIPRANGTGKVECSWHRMRDEGQNYLVSVRIGARHSFDGGGDATTYLPQTRAVVDDFGTLVCLRPWA